MADQMKWSILRMYSEIGIETPTLERLATRYPALFDVRCEISHRGLPKDGYAGENAGNTGMEWTVPENDINSGHAARGTLAAQAQSPRIAYSVTGGPEEQYGSAVIAT